MSVKKRMLAVSKSRGFQCKVKLVVYGFDKMHVDVSGGPFSSYALRIIAVGKSLKED